MAEVDMEMSIRRMADLERRVLALEERARRVLWNEEMAPLRKEEELTLRYGDYVDKTQAAQILGVTRATVYAMLADGRISGACSGRRVDVRSIARYMQMPRGQHRRREGSKKAADMPPQSAADAGNAGDDGNNPNNGNDAQTGKSARIGKQAKIGKNAQIGGKNDECA